MFLSNAVPSMISKRGAFVFQNGVDYLTWHVLWTWGMSARSSRQATTPMIPLSVWKWREWQRPSVASGSTDPKPEECVRFEHAARKARQMLESYASEKDNHICYSASACSCAYRVMLLQVTFRVPCAVDPNAPLRKQVTDSVNDLWNGTPLLLHVECRACSFKKAPEIAQHPGIGRSIQCLVFIRHEWRWSTLRWYVLESLIGLGGSLKSSHTKACQKTWLLRGL